MQSVICHCFMGSQSVMELTHTAMELTVVYPKELVQTILFRLLGINHRPRGQEEDSWILVGWQVYITIQFIPHSGQHLLISQIFMPQDLI